MTTQANNSLLPAYLIVGEDVLKRGRVLERLRARLEKMGDLSFNSDVFDPASEFTGADVVNACNTVPFASPVRLVEVRGVGGLSKQDMDPIVEYLGAPCETTVLALNTDKLAKNTRLYKAVAALGKGAVIDCAPPAARDVPKLVRDMAVAHGVTFSPAAASALVELVGESTVHLDAEIAKIALGHGGAEAVGEQEVREAVSRTAELKPWQLVDAFSARDTKKCLLYLSRMPSVSPHALLPMCTTRLRELLCARSLAKRGNATPGNIASALTAIAKKPKGKSARPRPKPEWACKNHVRWAKGFAAVELREALSSARDAEQAMKSGADPHAAFVEWMVSVTAPKR